MVELEYQKVKNVSVTGVRVRGKGWAGKSMRRLVVSNASPLIQITLADYLWLLPELYEVMVPSTVFEETQRYRDLPDAIEIAMATRAWLKVVSLERRERVEEIRAMGLGLGEAEAFALYEESNAEALLLTDEDAIEKARFLGFNAINLADVGREAYTLGILSAEEVHQYAKTFLEQRILITKYMMDLRKEAEGWLSK